MPADLSGRFSGNGPWLFLLRHGQIQGPGRFIGQTDLPLDQTGISQAQAWQPVLGQIRFCRIFTSGLSRCRDMAALCCPDQPVMLETRINEIHLGDWENQPVERIKTCFPEAFHQRGQDIFGFRPPRGESFEDLFSRAAPFFEEMISDLAGRTDRETAPILVITHAGVIRVMCCHWLGLPMDQLFSLRPGYGELLVFTRAGGV